MLRMIRGWQSLSWAVLFTISLAPAAMLSGCSSPSDSAKTEGADSKAAKRNRPTGSTAKKFETGREVLEAMAAAYRKAKTYQDHGAVRMVIQIRDQKPVDRSEPFAVSFERPNKLSMDVYTAKVRCDGKSFTLSWKICRAKFWNATRPPNGHQNYRIRHSFGPEFVHGSGRCRTAAYFIIERRCPGAYCSKARKSRSSASRARSTAARAIAYRSADPYGLSTFWVDRDSLVLRRIVLPSDSLRAEAEQTSGGPIESISVVAEFTGAELDRPVDSKAFAFEMPDGQFQTVKYFIPPHPGQWMGKKLPDFKFTDLTGNAITPQSLAGKTVVLIYWSGKFPSFGQNLLDFQKLSDAYKNNAKVAVCVVCADVNADPKALENYCRSIKIAMPIYRNLEETDPELRTTELPKLAYLIGPDGIMQDFEYDEKANFSAVLPPKIDRLLAGQNLSEQAAEAIEKTWKNMRNCWKTEIAKGKPFPRRKSPNAANRKRSSSSRFGNAQEVKDPGNIVVVQEPKRPPRLLVVSPPSTVAEIGLDGKVIALHKLNLTGGELVTNLRAFTTEKGKTYVAAFAGVQQRMHLFDLEDKLHLSYPEDALKNPHSGIADVELCDLDGSGSPKIYVGFWGVVGVHCVGLDGKRLWPNRSLANVARMAAGPADESGRRDLICMNLLSEQNSSLMVLNAQGQGQGEITIDKRSLRNFQSADLLGNGNPLWCALAVSNEGRPLPWASIYRAMNYGMSVSPANHRRAPSSRSLPAASLPTVRANGSCPSPTARS